MIPSRSESHAEEDESNNVRKAATESVLEEDFQKVAV